MSTAVRSRGLPWGCGAIGPYVRAYGGSDGGVTPWTRWARFDGLDSPAVYVYVDPRASADLGNARGGSPATGVHISNQPFSELKLQPPNIDFLLLTRLCPQMDIEYPNFV